jgi:quinol monooxygenase YgiN
MPELQVIARYTLAPGSEDEVLALLSQLAEASRGEPGNLAFEIYRGVEDPGTVILLERYADREAFAAHRESRHFKELVLERIVPLLERREVEFFEPVELA